MTCDNCIYGKRVFDNFTGQYYYECSDIQIVRKIGDYSYFETASSKTIKECPYGKAKQKAVECTAQPPRAFENCSRGERLIDSISQKSNSAK